MREIEAHEKSLWNNFYKGTKKLISKKDEIIIVVMGFLSENDSALLKERKMRESMGFTCSVENVTKEDFINHMNRNSSSK